MGKREEAPAARSRGLPDSQMCIGAPDVLGYKPLKKGPAEAGPSKERER